MACMGQCTWVWSESMGSWMPGYYNTCESGCICGPAPGQEGPYDGYVATVACESTGGTTTTTTTTPSACASSQCCWLAVRIETGGGSGYMAWAPSSFCPNGCACSVGFPPYNGTDPAPGDVYCAPCVEAATTTTSTTIGTTTTAGTFTTTTTTEATTTTTTTEGTTTTTSTMPLGPNEMDCCTSVKSTEFVLPRPYPCCGWVQPPASVSGTYRCISVPSSRCGTLPTTSTAFTLTLLSFCGSAYVYYNAALTFQFSTGVLGFCTEPTGTIVGSSIGTLGPGQVWVPDAGNGCSFVGGVHYLTFGGLLTQGNATLQILINQVTM